MSPADIYSPEGFGSQSTNPCGEIILSPYDSCRLMVVNLYSFVSNRFTPEATFDWPLFADVVQKAQRLMDDMVDLEIEQVNKILAKIDADPPTKFPSGAGPGSISSVPPANTKGSLFM